MSTRIISILGILLGFVSASLAQTNIIEWQTNWPAGGSNNLCNGNQQNLPTSSAWYTGTKADVLGLPNASGTSTDLVASVSSGSSLTWFTYFAPTLVDTNNPSPYTVETNSGMPVQLSPNETIQATVNFTVSGTAAQNTHRYFAFALLYAGTNANVTGGGNGSDNFLTGYGQNVNFGTTFSEPPLQTFAETNADNNNSQLASAADQVQIGDTGGGVTNNPGFTDGTDYTLVLSVTENNPTNVSITTTFYGSTFSNGVSITQTVTDTNYCYTNFDEFVMRPKSGAYTATNFTITSFKIATFVKSAAPSTNADLAGLALSTTGVLTPAFASNVLSYTVTEAYGGAPTITPTSADPNATVAIIYNSATNPITSGTASAPLALNADPGVPNVVDVEVTAQDGVTVQDYMVTITQLPNTAVRPTLTSVKSGSTLQLNWPLDHLGYRLLVQTNNLSKGISANINDWGTVSGSTSTNSALVPISAGQQDEFYQLVYP